MQIAADTALKWALTPNLGIQLLYKISQFQNSVHNFSIQYRNSEIFLYMYFSVMHENADLVSRLRMKVLISGPF